MARSIALGGIALHSGLPSSVLFGRYDGPIVLEQRGVRCALAQLHVERADSGVLVGSSDGALRVDLVEHVLAAVGGLGLTFGVRIVVDSGEPPLIDGGALSFLRALKSLGVPPTDRARRVVRPALFELGRSRYEFLPADHAAMEVFVEFAHPLAGESKACWDGSAEQFETDLAPARTFGFLSDWEVLKTSGRGRGANVRDVVVLCADGTTCSNPPPSAGECARHKLLDLVGDATLSGGVPRGHIRAVRPGHQANLEAFARASAQGVFGPA